MITVSEIAGKFAAHAVWCVSDGDTLIPMLVYADEIGELKMARLAGDDLGATVEHGKQCLSSNPMDATNAALVYDGRIPVGDEKLDALIIEMREYSSPDSEAILAIPYTPKDTGQFRVHRPKLLVWNGCEGFDRGQAFESFFKGVSTHPKGSAVWEQCLDESK